MAPTRPQPSAKLSRPSAAMPRMLLRVSLTPSGAASRFVCIQIAEMPFFSSNAGTSSAASVLSGWKMTG